MPSLNKQVLFNEAIKAICKLVLSSVKEAPAIQCILVAYDCTVRRDEVTSHSGTDFSQIDLVIEQSVDVTINSQAVIL